KRGSPHSAFAATARSMRRFSRRTSGLRRLAGVSNNQASSPPLCSTVRMPAADRRRRTSFPSASLIIEVSCTFGRNRRFVLLLAWLTLLPTITPLPVTSHRRAITQNPIEIVRALENGGIYGCAARG